jgi:hypothetical protein
LLDFSLDNGAGVFQRLPGEVRVSDNREGREAGERDGGAVDHDPTIRPKCIPKRQGDRSAARSPREPETIVVLPSPSPRPTSRYTLHRKK